MYYSAGKPAVTSLASIKTVKQASREGAKSGMKYDGMSKYNPQKSKTSAQASR